MAAVLDTLGDYFSRVTSMPTDYGTWTMMVWATQDANIKRAAAIIYPDRAGSDLYAYIGTNGLTLSAFNGTSVLEGSEVQPGRWYHFALRSDGLLYRDGTLEITHSSPGTGALASLSLGGVFGGAATLVGKLAYARVWNAILTGPEIETERTATTAQRTADLLSDDTLLSGAGSWTANGSITYNADDPLRRAFILG